MAFPNPDISTEHSIGTKTWAWDNEKWVLKDIVETFDFRKEDPMVVYKQGNAVTYSIDPSILETLEDS